MSDGGDDIRELAAQIRLLTQEQKITNDLIKDMVIPQLNEVRDGQKRADREIGDVLQRVSALEIAVHALETGAPKPKVTRRGKR